jgi:hypothetical protein
VICQTLKTKYLFIYLWFRFEAYQSRGSDDEEDEERPFGGQVFVHGKDDPLGKCANQFTKNCQTKPSNGAAMTTYQ